MRLFLIFATVAFISACSSNIATNYQLPADNVTGLVIGTITYAGETGLRRLYLKNVQTGEIYRAEVGQAQVLIPGIAKDFYDEDLQSEGGAFAIALPKGLYRVESWEIRLGPGWVASTTPINYQFNVEAQKSVYLGRFDFQDTDSIGLRTTSAEVSLRDKSEVDIPLLKNRYQVINSAPITSAIESGTNASKLGGSSSQHINITPYMVTPIR